MAYWKLQKTADGKYYPQSVTKGKPVSTRRIAQKLALVSTVSEADARAVLSMLGEVMADYLAAGRSIKLDGLGSFRLVGHTGKTKAVDDPKQVSAKMFEGVRVRFIPETQQQANGAMTRAMLGGEIDWIKLTAEEAAASDAEEETPGGSNGNGDDLPTYD